MKKPPTQPAFDADIRIGISGWTYAPWRGIFFPPALPQKEELAFASRQVNSIEINGTFYSLQRPASYAAWYDQTPPDFVFSLKGPRFITHLLRLQNSRTALANFFGSGGLRLQEKLGPILWQLPPSFAYDPKRLEAFFRLLPRDTKAAAALGRDHDDHLRHGSWLKIDRNRPLRHALEVRHDSFKTPEFVALLRAHQIALVIADTAGKWPAFADVTADFMYLRLHGAERLYASGYTPQALRSWARKIGAWACGQNAARSHLLAPPRPSLPSRDVYVYFDNDVKTRAPFDARALSSQLGIGAPPAPRAPDNDRAGVPRRHWPALHPAAAVKGRKRQAGAPP